MSRGILIMVPKVASYMTQPVITAAPESNLMHVRNLMIRHKIGRVVIVDSSGIAGIVSKSDFTKLLFNRKRYLKPLDEISASDIMSSPVYATSPNRSIKFVAKFMAKHSIGSLPIVDNKGNLCGIITATDILRAFSERCRGILSVMDVVDREPPTILPTHSIFNVIESLIQSKVKKVVVVDGNNKPLGIIAKSDVLALFFNIGTAFRIGMHHRGVRSIYEIVKSGIMPIASDIMTPDPITVTPDEDLAKVADIMVKNRISCLPVTNSRDSLIGIVIKDDIIRAIKST